MKLTMKTKREPQAGDVWRRYYEDGSVAERRIVGLQIRPIGLSNEIVAAFDDGSTMFTRDLVEHFTLVTTGAVTLEEREQLGTMPDIDDDNRTPLEKAQETSVAWRMINERLAHREAFARDWAASQARVVRALKVSQRAFTEMTAERDALLRQLTTAERDALRRQLTAADQLTTAWLHQRTFARAFAASQGRVIAGLKADCAELVAERDGTDAGIDAAIASVVAEFERQDKCTAERMESLTLVADELGSLDALPPGAKYGNVWGGADLAEALDALRGMVEAYHPRGTLPPHRDVYEPIRGPGAAALEVLAKHGIVKNWNGRHADWAKKGGE